MIDRIFFDTNIIVYMFDKSEKEKHEVAKDLLSKQAKKSSFYISAQVINEFVNITTRKIKNPVSFEKQKDILSFLNSIFIISPLTMHTSQTAINIKLKYKYSYWDSLILTSALENQCSIIYSEDMQDNQLIDGNLQIVNPFL